MSQEVIFEQISHKTFSVFLNKIQITEFKAIWHMFQTHRAHWNPIVNRLEFPSQEMQAILAELSKHWPKFAIKTVPIRKLWGALNHHSKRETQDKNLVYIQPTHKWNRFIALDPLLLRRFDLVLGFLLPRTKTKENIRYKRCLLVCQQIKQPQWQRFFIKHKIAFKSLDYQTLQENRITKPVLKQHQFEILNYSWLSKKNLPHQVINKFDTTIWDDSEHWISKNQTYFYDNRVPEFARMSLYALKEEKDIIIFVNKFNYQKIYVIKELACILKPYNFGDDPIKAAKKEVIDAQWMERRYRRKNKLSRELTYVLSSSIFINLLRKNCPFLPQTLSGSPNFIYVNFDTTQMNKLRSFDNRFKNINKNQIITSLQSHRTHETQLMNPKSNLEQARYLRELRSLVTQEKMPQILQWLYHVAYNQDHNIAVVVQSQLTQKALEKFFIQEQVPYVVYSINLEDIQQKGPGFKKFNCDLPAKVCILVRERLLMQYRLARRDLQRKVTQDKPITSMKIDTRNFRIISGPQLTPLEQIKFDRKIFQLQKINSVNHILFLDTFWFDFSPIKQQIIANIFDCPLFSYDQVAAAQKARLIEDGIIRDWEEFICYKSNQIIHHYALVKGSYQHAILEKYLNNLKELKEESSQESSEQKSLESFWRKLLAEQREKQKGLKTQEEVYDIDQAFDRLQFEAQKEKERLEKEGQRDTPVYNTKIDGLVIETPRIDQMKSKQPGYTTSRQIELKGQQKPVNIQELSWLQSSSSQSQDTSQSQKININKYLVVKETDKDKMNSPMKAEQSNSKHKQKKTSEKKRKVRLADDCVEMKEEKSSYGSGKKPVKVTIPNAPFLTFEKQTGNHQPLKFSNKKVLDNLKEVAVSSKRYFFSGRGRSKQRERGRVKKGMRIWGPQSKEKVIAPKKKDLHVRLVPMQSTLTSPYIRQ